MSEGISGQGELDVELPRKLEEHPFLRDTPASVRERLAAITREPSFAEGSVLFREGEPAETLYLVGTGLVALELHVPGKGTVRLESVGPGDIVGLSWLFPPYRRHFDARAIRAVTALALDGAQLRAWIRDDPVIGHALATRFAHQLYQRLERVRMQRLDLYKAEP